MCGAPYKCIIIRDIITNQALVAVILHLYTGRLVSMKVAYEGLCIYVHIFYTSVDFINVCKCVAPFINI